MTSAARRWGKRSDMVVHEDEPFNAEPDPSALVGHRLTPTDAFYARNHGSVPRLDATAWRLTVDGGVATALTLSLAELKDRFAPATVVATLQCAGNRRAGLLAIRDIPGEDPWRDCATSTAQWSGVRLADVLAAAGVAGDPAGRHVAFTAPDQCPKAAPAQGYGGSIPLHKALAGEVLLAWDMNGAPLLPVHGAPVRVVVPGWIGARSVKWVERITVQCEPSSHYFQSVAYRLLPPDGTDPRDGFSLGPVALNSAILSPIAGQTLPAGPTSVRGYAFAGDGRQVARVDVSADDGVTWIQADLGADLGRWAWRLWHATIELTSDTVLIARAWDHTGALQPADPADVWNPKGYVNNSWPRNPVQVVTSR
jgi:sulfite oxidase